MLKLEQLYYLTKVAKYNSINKAAEELYITKAAVSAAIKQLEKECGYPILERTYHGVRLTKNGEKVVKLAEQVIALCEEIETMPLEQEEQRDKTRLVITPETLKLLSKKIVGPSSKVIKYFLIEEQNNYARIKDAIINNAVVLLTLTPEKRKKIEENEFVICVELYKSNLYPVSNKNTKYLDKNCKKITHEQWTKLPKIVMGDTFSQENNIVLYTWDATVYSEAIMNDYGFGLFAKFAPDIYTTDYSLFKVYEPLDIEMTIALVSKSDFNQKEIDLLKTLIMNA